MGVLSHDEDWGIDLNTIDTESLLRELTERLEEMQSTIYNYEEKCKYMDRNGASGELRAKQEAEQLIHNLQMENAHLREKIRVLQNNMETFMKLNEPTEKIKDK